MYKASDINYRGIRCIAVRYTLEVSFETIVFDKVEDWHSGLAIMADDPQSKGQEFDSPQRIKFLPYM